LLAEIRKGEGLALEFKPYIRVAKDESKRIELIETAIAFANTTGGAILLGVNDTGEIEGIERQLFNPKKKQELIASAADYGQAIRKMMNENTSVRLDLDVEPIHIAGHILLQIRVKEIPSGSKPAWKLDTKETWIRRGATNFRPDPEMIRDYFRRKEEGLEFLGLGQPSRF
jgi:predicted HTH transcriptional regulator